MSAQDKGEELPCWMLSSQRDQPVPPSGQVVLKAQNRILPGFEPSPERNKFNQPFFFIQVSLSSWFITTFRTFQFLGC